jgi:triacylglycerol esterase/lipase EstA (alpha/beta hydrolase family)
MIFASLVGGAIAYVHEAARLLERGTPMGLLLAGAVLAYFAPAVLLTVSWFACAWVWRTPRPPPLRLSWAGSLRLYCNELFAVAKSWPLVALHRCIIRDPAPASARRAILLVHGVLINDGVWFSLRRHLMAAGLGPVYTVNYGPPLADIEHFADQLAATIERVRAATGNARVLLIGHSMGGLVSRAYLRRHGNACIDRLITIGTPHHGSMLARGLPGTCMAQITPGNAWLKELNREESRPLSIAITSIWSRHDSMVAPQASCELTGADNIALTGIGHNALLTDASTRALVTRLVASL